MTATSSEVADATVAPPLVETELGRLTRDIRDATSTMSGREARFLVDAYYAMQDRRIASDGQVRAATADEEPHRTTEFFAAQNRALENMIKSALNAWTDSSDLGQWLKSISGIGPVIAAGIMAHVDIEKAPTAGHIWRYAGLDPTVTWEKGQKRPWNADLKVICWKAGESFVKVQSSKKDIYGKVYAARKDFEAARNETVKKLKKPPGEDEMFTVKHLTPANWENGGTEIGARAHEIKTVAGESFGWFVGGNAESAAKVLGTKRIGKDTDAFKAYSIGLLPPGHLHARAKRYAVKLFLAHFHEVAYELHFNEKPPLPYPIAQLGHTHLIPAPNRDVA